MNLVSVNKFMTTIDSKFLYASYARSIGEGGGYNLLSLKDFMIGCICFFWNLKIQSFTKQGDKIYRTLIIERYGKDYIIKKLFAWVHICFFYFLSLYTGNLNVST